MDAEYRASEGAPHGGIYIVVFVSQLGGCAHPSDIDSTQSAFDI